MLFNKKHVVYLILFLLVFLSFAVRIHSLRSSFVLDDYRLIIDNSFIQNTSNFFVLLNPKNFFDVLPVVCGARPVSLLSLMTDFALFGYSPAGYHFVNLLLHCLNSVLLFLFVLGIKKKYGFAFFAALFFSLHPIQSEVVNVASFRADLLAVFFILVFLNFANMLRNTNDNKPKIVILMIAAFLCALFSKENSVIIPFILLPYCVFFYGKNRTKYFFIAAASVVTALFLFFFWLERFPVPFYELIYPNIEKNTAPLDSFVSYILNISAALWYNFAHLVYPVNLSVDYVVRYSFAMFVFSGLFIALIVFAVFKSKDKFFKFALFFAAVAYIPVSNLVPLVNTVADRYLYLPMAAISIIFAYAVDFLFKNIRRISVSVFLIILFLIYGFISFQRGIVYSNQYNLYYDASLKNPDNIRVAYNMAVAYLANGEYKEAIKQFEKVSLINPVYKRENVWLLTGEAYELSGDKEHAQKYYLKAFLINSSDFDVSNKFVDSFESPELAKKYLLRNTSKISREMLLNFEKTVRK